MRRCEIAAECWFYKSEIDPQSQEFELLRKYCHGNYLDCARYRFARSFGIAYVPRGLQPNDTRKVRGVLDALVC
jgi:hypothetical protein